VSDLEGIVVVAEQDGEFVIDGNERAKDLPGWSLRLVAAMVHREPCIVASTDMGAWIPYLLTYLLLCGSSQSRDSDARKVNQTCHNWGAHDESDVAYKRPP